MRSRWLLAFLAKLPLRVKLTLFAVRQMTGENPYEGVHNEATIANIWSLLSMLTVQTLECDHLLCLC